MPVAALSADDLAITEQSRLIWVRVQDARALIWRDNLKLHDIGSVMSSIARYGWQDKPRYDETLGAIKHGNGRIEALALMEESPDYKTPPRGIALEKESGAWCMQLEVGVDAKSLGEAKAYALDANNLTVMGGDAGLAEVMAMWGQGFENQLLDLANTGDLPVSIDADDVDAILNQVKADSTTGESKDATPKAKLAEEWAVVPGQVWVIPSERVLGEHRLMCGDSTDAADVARLLDGAQPVLLHADPPYGMGKEKDGVANDNHHGVNLDAFQMKWWVVWREHLTAVASVYIWGNPEDLWRLWYLGGLKDSERLTFKNIIVWSKLAWGGEVLDAIGKLSDGMRCYPPNTERCLFFMRGAQDFGVNATDYWEGWEPIRSYLEAQVKALGWGPKDIKRITGVSMYSHWFTQSQWTFITKEHYEALQAAQAEAFGKDYEAFAEEYETIKRDYEEIKGEFYKTRAYFDNTHETMTDVWPFERVWDVEERRGFPTPKPVPMIERVMKSSAPLGAVTCSPFCGSGTDIIAAQNTGRLCYSMEIEPKWAAVTLQRLKDAGLEPQLDG